MESRAPILNEKRCRINIDSAIPISFRHRVASREPTLGSTIHQAILLLHAMRNAGQRTADGARNMHSILIFAHPLTSWLLSNGVLTANSTPRRQVRIAVSLAITSYGDLSSKERLYVALSWVPKADVQVRKWGSLPRTTDTVQRLAQNSLVTVHWALLEKVVRKQHSTCRTFLFSNEYCRSF